MRVLFFGSYDLRVAARVRVLQEGFAALGDEVLECNVPLGLDTAERVQMLRRPWLLPLLALRLGTAWSRLWRRARSVPPPDVVIVGSMGHFDVHLARRVWPRGPIVLDHLVSAKDTALDRRVTARPVLRALEWLDRAALGAADLACVDTDEHLAALPKRLRERGVVVPVGAPERCFIAPRPLEPGPLRVLFYGSYTPLQGAPVIGHALGLLAEEQEAIAVTMVGRGQDLEAARGAAARNGAVEWVEWVEADELPALVAEHDVCLGIFGTSPKALRVVPNKVFQGAAGGAAVVTSDTPPQRRVLGDAAVYVPPGDPALLAAVLRVLAADRERVWALRLATFEHADRHFRPAAVVAPLRDRLATRATS